MATAMANLQIKDKTCDRPGCPGRLAVSYCITCGEKLCDSHKKAHDGFHEKGHSTIPIADYAKAPGRFQKTYCDRHGDFEIVKACRHCDRQICMECDVHAGRCMGNRQRHDFVALQDLAGQITSYYKSLEQKANSKRSQLDVLDRRALQMLKAEDKKCADWVREIEQALDRKIQELMDEAELVKKKVYSHQRRVKEKTTSYRSGLTSQKRALEKDCSAASDLLERENISQLIRRKEDVTRAINNKVDHVVDEMKLSVQPSLYVRNEKVSLGVEFHLPPTSLTHLHSTQQFNGCYSASHRADGNILLGTDEGVKLLKRDQSVISYNTPFKAVTSVVEHHNAVYLLHREGDVCKVVMGTPDLNNWQTLFEFTNKTTFGASMTVCSKYIVVMNPEDDDYQLIIYDFINKQRKIRRPDQRVHPYFLPNEDLLAVNNEGEPKLSRCRIEEGELTELWTCGGLVDIYKAVADGEGLIYGLTWKNQKSVCIISPDGKLLYTIHNEKLPATPGFASIKDGQLALPGWEDNRLHLYRINQ